MSALAAAVCSTETEEGRFWAKVRKGGPGDCWIWTASQDSSGYGRFAREGRRLSGAHRVSLELRGVAIPDGMVVDHICRTRLCVNPAHLRVVSRLTNVRENSNAPGHLNSLKTHCPRGHVLAGENLVASHGYRTCRECKNAKARERRNAQTHSSREQEG